MKTKHIESSHKNEVSNGIHTWIDTAFSHDEISATYPTGVFQKFADQSVAGFTVLSSPKFVRKVRLPITGEIMAEYSFDVKVEGTV